MPRPVASKLVVSFLLPFFLNSPCLPPAWMRIDAPIMSDSDYEADDASSFSGEAAPSHPPPVPGSLVARGRAFLPCRHWKDTQEAWGTCAVPLCSHVIVCAVQLGQWSWTRWRMKPNMMPCSTTKRNPEVTRTLLLRPIHGLCCACVPRCKDGNGQDVQTMDQQKEVAGQQQNQVRKARQEPFRAFDPCGRLHLHRPQR